MSCWLSIDGYILEMGAVAIGSAAAASANTNLSVVAYWNKVAVKIKL